MKLILKGLVMLVNQRFLNPDRLVFLFIAWGFSCDGVQGPINEDDMDHMGCPVVASSPIERGGTLTEDEVWKEGLHHVTSSVIVGAGTKLTIEPCATVRIATDQSITVSADSQGLFALGTEAKPIVFERIESSRAWGSLLVFAPSTIHLEHVKISGGGTTQTNGLGANLAGASLAVRNLEQAHSDSLFVKRVIVEDSNGLGVMLVGSGFISGSEDLTVRGSGAYPIYLGAGMATNLPTGDYSGNGRDFLLLQSVGPSVYENDQPILRDAVLPDRGLPYLVGTVGTFPSISVGDGREESPAASLRIEPGVELRFQGGSTKSAQLIVRGKPDGDNWAVQGALIAEGTAEKPITFTSANQNPQPGDWQGLYFKNIVAPQTLVSHARIEFAGGESSSTGLCVSTLGAPNNDADCSAILWLDVPPTAPFIQNTHIENGGGCGIYRGWQDVLVDFTPTNTFANLVGCDQSDVHVMNQGCVGTCN